MFACNQGGHFSQMMALKELFGEYHTILVTDNIHATKETIPALKSIDDVVYEMSMANKRKNIKPTRKVKWSRVRAIRSYFSLFSECKKIWDKYHPAVII